MIYEDLSRARAAHRAAIIAQQDAANEEAEAQYALDMAEAAAYSALRDAGEPVTLIPKLAKGDPEVAKARRRAAIAEGVYKAACARTQATYLDWKHADAQFAREWQSGGM